MAPFLADSRLSRKKLLFTAMIQRRLAVDDPLQTVAYNRLIRSRLGKRISCTDNESWSTEEIVLGSQAQSCVEDAFKLNKQSFRDNHLDLKETEGERRCFG